MEVGDLVKLKVRFTPIQCDSQMYGIVIKKVDKYGDVMVYWCIHGLEFMQEEDLEVVWCK